MIEVYTLQPKNMLIINILDILKKHSDEEHRLSQKDIIRILEREYNMKANRTAIKRNLMNLIDAGYNISFSESKRLNKNGEQEILYTDWYLEQDFSHAELRLMIDHLLFSKDIPYSQCKDLIKKIEGLSNKYFKHKVKHVCNLPEDQPVNKELFYTIEILDEAINRQKQVEFIYNYYDTDKRLSPRRNDKGEIRQYIVNPYQMVATNARYYLICNYDKYHDVAYYRLDRMTNIKLLDTNVKPMTKVKGLENGLDLPKHMAEHIYMFTGPSGRVVFQSKSYLVSEIIDWFGKDVDITTIDQGEVRVSVKANYQAISYWAMQYVRHIKIIKPKILADQIKEDLQEALEKYKEE